MQDLAPMLMLMTLFVTIGGVILLRPISKHLGEYLRVLAEQKRVQSRSPDLARIESVLAAMESRLNHLEDRQQFSEALLDARHAGRPRSLEESESAPQARRLSAQAE